MIALDTNALVRLLVDSTDAPQQSQQVRALVTSLHAEERCEPADKLVTWTRHCFVSRTRRLCGQRWTAGLLVVQGWPISSSPEQRFGQERRRFIPSIAD